MVSFIWDQINFRWQQYKRKPEEKSLIPITWEKFKAFLHKALEDSRVFANSYQAKIKRDSQYQFEEVLDWTIYLKYLQAILKKFDLATTPNKKILIWYFREELSLFIRA